MGYTVSRAPSSAQSRNAAPGRVLAWATRAWFSLSLKDEPRGECVPLHECDSHHRGHRGTGLREVFRKATEAAPAPESSGSSQSKPSPRTSFWGLCREPQHKVVPLEYFKEVTLFIILFCGGTCAQLGCSGLTPGPAQWWLVAVLGKTVWGAEEQGKCINHPCAFFLELSLQLLEA